MSLSESFTDFKGISKIAISFLLLALLAFPIDAISQELNQDQQEFSKSIDEYNQLRANQMKQQARAEELKKSKNIELAQTLSDDQTETQDERIEQLERKLQSVTQELQDLKTSGMSDERLKSIEDKISILAGATRPPSAIMR